MSQYEEVLEEFDGYAEYKKYIKEIDEILDFSKINNCDKEKLDTKTIIRLKSLYKDKKYTLEKIGKPLYYIEKIETLNKLQFLLSIFVTTSMYVLLLISLLNIDYLITNKGGTLMLIGMYSGVAYMSTNLNIERPYFFSKEVFKTLIFPFNKFTLDSYEFARYIIGREGFYYTKQSSEIVYTFKYFLDNKEEIQNKEFWKLLDVKCQEIILNSAKNNQLRNI